MQSDDFHILVQREQVQLNWRKDQGTPYALARGLEKDRLIARILQKVLNMHLIAGEMEVFGIEEFKVLGTTLFNLLFNSDELLSKFDEFYKEAKNSTEQRHRIILEFDESASDLALFPWEYLFYEGDKEIQAFLGAYLKKCIDLVRKLPYPCKWLELDKTKQVIEPPLRVLVIITDDVRKDVESIVGPNTTYFNELKQEHPSLFDCRFIIEPDANNLSERINRIILDDKENPFHPHVIHFIGRSRIDEGVSQISFPQNLDNGEVIENWVNEDTFANYFEDLKYQPHLFFLHVPDGVPVSDYEKERGIVLKLMKKSIPFVVAMQNPVPDWMAQQLMQSFYQSLLEGLDLANALTESRIDLARKSKDSRGLKYDDYAHKVFGSPVLYASVDRPFALAIKQVTVEKQERKEQYKICVDHPDRRYPLSESNCYICGRKLILPPEFQTASQATAKESSQGASGGRVVEKPQTSAAGAGKQQPGGFADVNQPGMSNPHSGTSNMQTTSSSDFNQQLNQLQRKGMEERLLTLTKKLNFLTNKHSEISDPNQLFQVGLEIEEVKKQIDILKKSLGLD